MRKKVTKKKRERTWKVRGEARVSISEVRKLGTSDEAEVGKASSEIESDETDYRPAEFVLLSRVRSDILELQLKL